MSLEKIPRKTLSPTTYNETIAKAISKHDSDVYWEGKELSEEARRVKREGCLMYKIRS